MEGYGQRVLTGVFGCEGEEVTAGWSTQACIFTVVGNVFENVT
jgi:hypothetical protein